MESYLMQAEELKIPFIQPKECISSDTNEAQQSH